MTGSATKQSRLSRGGYDQNTGLEHGLGQDHRLSRIRTRGPRLRTGRGARAPLARVRAAAAGSRLCHPGRALHELRRALLHGHRRARARRSGLPGQQPDPRLERPRLWRQLGRGRAQSAFDQQFSRSHRPHLPGAVRSLLHAQHRRESGHHQIDRMRHRRPRHRAGPEARTADGKNRQKSRNRRLGSGRHGLRATDSRVPATMFMSTKNTPRPAAF